jgi:hypothetical protein
MKLSRATHRKFENFLREYFADENLVLPEIQIYCRGGARVFTKILKVDGVTFGRHIFIKPKYLRRDENNRLVAEKDLLAHELTHTIQYRRHGAIKFFYTYLSGFWRALRGKKSWDFQSRLKSYMEIPHEIEARDCAVAFLRFSRENYSSVSSK